MNPSGSSLLCYQPGREQGEDVQTFTSFALFPVYSAAETSDVAQQRN